MTGPAAELEYAIRRVPDLHLLARSCAPEPALVEPLLLDLAADIEAGKVHSSRAGIAGVAVFLAGSAPPKFAAGVPAERGAGEIEEYAPLEVPGGRYAMLTLGGEFEQVPMLFAALFEAVAFANERATGDTITVYRDPVLHGESLTELGVRLAS